MGWCATATIQMQPLDLNETASGVLQLVASDAKRRRIQLRSELAIGLTAGVCGPYPYRAGTAEPDRQRHGRDAEHPRVGARAHGANDGAMAMTRFEVGVSDRGSGIPTDQM